MDILAGIFAIIYLIFCLGIIVLSVYALILAIKALKIYIRKNS